MIKIQCNRCGKEIDPRQKVGFIQICSVSPFDFADHEQNESISERAHYCDDCVAEIWNFMQNKPKSVKEEVESVAPAVSPTLVDEQPKEEPKKRQRIDIGKIMALKKAGWSNKDIADEMDMTSQQVAVAIYQQKKRMEASKVV